MDGEVAPEFIYDQGQGLYYPPVNYYPYVCTGMGPPNEWDDQHKFLSSDGQEIQFSGLQTESLPCVYYTPSYEYAQSPYNPFNPYIPGAAIGTDNQFIGTQQNFSGAPYLQTVSNAPGYIPFVCQPGSDTLLNGYPDQVPLNGNAPKYAPSLPSLSAAAPSLKLSLDNLSLDRSQTSSHQMHVSGREGVNAVPRKQFSSYGAVVNGSAPQMIQRMEQMPHGGIPSVRSSVKVNLPANNVTNLRANVPEWVPGDRMRPRNHYSGFPSRSLGEQNRPPRTNNPRVQLPSPISLRAYTTKAGSENLDGNIIVHADQYNRDDFPVDYQDAKFFVIKSYSEDDVHKSIKYNVWSSTSSGNRKLSIAYEEAMRLSVGKPRKCPVFLFFSVNASGHFCGVAEMDGPVDFHKDMDFWLQDKWPGSFPVKWHIIKDVPNSSFRHIILVNNEYRPVTSSRDTQEIPYLPGINMLTIFKNSPLNTSILDDFMHYEERQRTIQEEKSVLGEVHGTPIPPRALVTSVKPADITSQPSKSEDAKPIMQYEERQRTVQGEKSVLGGKVHEIPVPSRALVTSVQPDDVTSQRSKSEDAKPNGSYVQPSTVSAKETDTEANNLESDGRVRINHTVEQDPSTAGKQRNLQLSSHVSAPVGRSKGAGQSKNAVTRESSQLENAGKQINHTVKQFQEVIPKQAKHPKVPKGSVRSGSSDVHVISRLPTVDAQEIRRDTIKIGKTDILTVGSMEIKLTNTNNSFAGPITSGPTRSEKKG